MALARFHGQAQDGSGNVVPQPSVTVQQEVPGLPLASVFSDLAGTTPLGNPFSGETDGSFTFCAEDGVYRITATKDALSKTIIEQQVGVAGAVKLDDIGISAPAIVNPPTYRYSIFDFPGALTQRSTPTATADYQAVITAALASGEKIHFPVWEYPIRTQGSAPNGVDLIADVPIDVECSGNAVFIPGEVFFGVSGSMFRIGQTSNPTPNGDYRSFRWIGGKFDGTDLTTAHGQGSGFGLNMLSLYRQVLPVVEGVQFFGGLTTMAAGEFGCGAIDTGIDTHACVGERLRDNSFIGFYDLGIYVSGFHQPVTLGANPIATVNGSPTVTITWNNHGLTAGAKYFVGINGATAVGGLTIFGQYRVQTTPTANTFTITAASDATSTATGGGAAVIIVDMWKMNNIDKDQGGLDGIYQGNRFYRCAQAISIKRGFLGYSILDNFIHQCGQGILASNVSNPNADGKIGTIAHNRLFKIQRHGIRVVGGPDNYVHHNWIRNFGKYISDDGATFDDVGGRIAAIDMRSTDYSTVDHNSIRNDSSSNWSSFTGATGNMRPIGIQFQPDPLSGYISAGQKNQIDHNIIDRVYQGIVEASACDTNTFNNNKIRNASIADSYAGTFRSLTMPLNAAATIALVGSSGTPTYDVQAINYIVREGILSFDGLIDLLTKGGLDGDLSISGLPFANALPRNVIVHIRPQYVVLGAGSIDVVGQVGSGGTEILLWQININGVWSRITGAMCSDASRFYITGQYPVN